ADSIFYHKEEHTLFDKLDMGKISAGEFYEGIREISGLKELSDDQIKDAWNALLIGVPKENHDILLEMKSRYRTFLLSNNNEIHYQFLMNYLKENFGLEDNSSYIEKEYYSHLMGMRKPNRNIFEFVINEHI